MCVLDSFTACLIHNVMLAYALLASGTDQPTAVHATSKSNHQQQHKENQQLRQRNNVHQIQHQHP
jgi:hypothetical protein